MVRGNAQEVKEGILAPRYYRMHIRPARHSHQHEMLLDLERDGKEVYYCAPAFHTPEELNDAYLNHMVRDKSLWLAPSKIGMFHDDEDHYVAFNLNGLPYVKSDPHKISATGKFEEFTKSVESSYRERSGWALLPKQVSFLSESIARIAEKRTDISSKTKKSCEDTLASRHPLAKIAFYASVFMDCQFFIVSEKEKS